jgi:hypothetical protein
MIKKGGFRPLKQQEKRIFEIVYYSEDPENQGQFEQF